MPRFAANLSMMFTEVPFLDRFEAAAKAGFTSVEFLFPYDHPADDRRRTAEAQRPDAGAVQPAAGQLGRRRKGFAALPDRFDDLKQSLRHGAALCAGDRRQAAASDGGHRQSQRYARRSRQFYKSVAWAAEFFAPHGLDVVIEPINARNVPGYFLNDFVLRARPDHRAEDPEPETAVRHLSLPDHPWRRHHAAARDDADHRPRPDRQHSLAQRARRRGAELSVPVRRARPARLWRLRRLRIQPARQDHRRPRLVQALCRSESRETVSGLHRRRLHRRLRSRQHADPSGPAHGADHRRALRRSRAARGRCGGGLAEEPLDRGGSGGRRARARPKNGCAAAAPATCCSRSARPSIPPTPAISAPSWMRCAPIPATPSCW